MISTSDDIESTEQANSERHILPSPENGADSALPVAKQPDHDPEAASPVTAYSDELAPYGDLSGQVVGHYRVIQRLGGGAMASVYRAHDQILERTVALKVLLPGADSVARERFRREARTVASLRHDHIVQTYQVGQTSAHGIIYIAMELVAGDSLADLLERQGALAAPDSCRILASIAGALAYAHERGVVHRDVKPSNILLRRAEEGAPGSISVLALDYPVVPLLSDFGIARALDSPELTSVGRTIGTPAFMSPEQCAGNADIDGRADIYSLGAVLYRCVVGRTPFVGTTTQILHAHVYDPLLMPENVAAQLPAVVIEVLRRSLMKQPVDRYSRAALMEQDLSVGAGSVPPGDTGNVDQTTTLLSLPVQGRQQASTGAKVLVPAGRSASKFLPSATSRRDDQRTTSPSAINRRTEKQSNRTGILILGVALFILVGIVVITAINAMAPSLGVASDPTQTARLTGTTTVSPAGTSAPVSTMMPTSAPTADESQETDSVEAVRPMATRQTPPSTSTVIPPLEVSIEYAWDNAQAFHEEGDWREALTWLIAVQRISEDFQSQRVEEMLVSSYINVAVEAVDEGEFDRALDYFDATIEIAGNAPAIVALREATAAYAVAPGDAMAGTRKALQEAFSGYASDLAAEEKYCAAEQQIANAVKVMADVELLDVQANYKQECSGALAEEALSELSGSLVYSAEEGGAYQIFHLPLGEDSSSTLLIRNGAQPGVRPDGRLVALFSLRPDMQGLVGFDLDAGLDPNDRTLRYTNFVEDARDSPPSWNPQGDRMAYASTNFGDGRSRIYLTWADGSRTTTTLALGKDPAWHPARDLIVYNGSDDSGNRQGLWLINVDGSGREQLTDNGNDQRPTWSADGRYVVFMSNGRHGNWEIYRVDVEDLSVSRLTNHLAQDGLPSVSPDGKHVAFMSDRDGYWRVWYVPTEGGEPRPLASIDGAMPKWLEHAIQWVE